MTDYSKITALYSRLSVGDEDRDGGESNSIQNQKIFLENYARGQHLTNIRHYIDDDESGRFFDRSAYHHITGRAVRLFHNHSGIYIGPLRMRHYSAAGSAVGENAVRCPVDPFRVHQSLLVFLSPATDCIMDLLHHHSCTYFFACFIFRTHHSYKRGLHILVISPCVSLVLLTAGFFQNGFIKCP